MTKQTFLGKIGDWLTDIPRGDALCVPRNGACPVEWTEWKRATAGDERKWTK